jgi:hypothetical protein
VEKEELIQDSKTRSLAKRLRRQEAMEAAKDIVFFDTQEINDCLLFLKNDGYKIHIQHYRVLGFLYEEPEYIPMSEIRELRYQSLIHNFGGKTVVTLEKKGWKKEYISKCHTSIVKKNGKVIKGDPYVRRTGVLLALRKARADNSGIY